jgi:hypothetical protein
MKNSFIAVGKDQECTEVEVLPNAPFFGSLIRLSQYRAASRIDRTAADAQVIAALRAAIAWTNGELDLWYEACVLNGFQSIDDVPSPAHQIDDFIVACYKRAVFSWADSLLCENYRDFDSSGDGATRGDAMAERIENHRREAIYAIADLTAQRRNRYELL